MSIIGVFNRVSGTRTIVEYYFNILKLILLSVYLLVSYILYWQLFFRFYQGCLFIPYSLVGSLAI